MTDGESEPREGARFRIQTRNGSFIDLDELRKREAGKLRQGVVTFLLRAGDVIAFRCEDPDRNINGYTYEVTKTESRGPREIISGQLYGYGLPEAAQDKEVTLVGSGWGGSMISPGSLTTDRRPYFGWGTSRDEWQEYMAPVTTYMEVFRPDEAGELVSVDGVVRYF